MTCARIWSVRAAALLLMVAWPALASVEPLPAKSLLWKVSSEKGSIFILGSVHAVSDDFYPMSEAIERAYEGAEVVVFEVDLSKMSQAAIAMLEKGLLPDGKVLSDVISAETYALVEQRLSDVGLDIAFFQNMEPWLLALTATAFEFQKAGFSMENGIDQHFHGRAVDDNKTVQALETIDFQVGLFAELGGEKGEEFLLYTLTEIETMLPLLEEIKRAWKSGDGEALSSMLTTAFAEHPALFEKLVTDRNRQWMPAIRKLLHSGKPGLVVVGSLHLVGEQGLVELLRADGNRVEQR